MEQAIDEKALEALLDGATLICWPKIPFCIYHISPTQTGGNAGLLSTI
jgi:hypothetical protein